MSRSLEFIGTCALSTWHVGSPPYPGLSGPDPGWCYDRESFVSFQMKTARPLIVSAFTKMDQFDLFLIEEFNINRQAEIEGSILNTVVLNTILKAEAEGWLPQLIAAVARARP